MKTTKSGKVSNRHIVVSFIVYLLFLSSIITAQNALLRFPDIHDSTIVFVAGEDIWTVPAKGGIATRIKLMTEERIFLNFHPMVT